MFSTLPPETLCNAPSSTPLSAFPKPPMKNLSDNSAISPSGFCIRTKLFGRLQLPLFQFIQCTQPARSFGGRVERQGRQREHEKQSPSLSCFWFKSHWVKNFNTKPNPYKTLLYVLLLLFWETFLKRALKQLMNNAKAKTLWLLTFNLTFILYNPQSWTTPCINHASISQRKFFR